EAGRPQDSGTRRRLHSEGAQPRSGGRGGPGGRGGGVRDGAPGGPRRGDVVRHQWRRRGVGGGAGGASPGKRGQTDRRRPARPRRALPQHTALSGGVTEPGSRFGLASTNDSRRLESLVEASPKRKHRDDTFSFRWERIDKLNLSAALG